MQQQQSESESEDNFDYEAMKRGLTSDVAAEDDEEIDSEIYGSEDGAHS